jgi:hypothetical protein
MHPPGTPKRKARTAVRTVTGFSLGWDSPGVPGYPLNFSILEITSVSDHQAPVLRNSFRIRARLREEPRFCQLLGGNAYRALVDSGLNMVFVNPAASLTVRKPFEVRTVAVLCHKETVMRSFVAAALPAASAWVLSTHPVLPRKRQGGYPSTPDEELRPGL